MPLAGVGLGMLETVAFVQLYLGPTHAQQITEVVTFMQVVMKVRRLCSGIICFVVYWAELFKGRLALILG